MNRHPWMNMTEKMFGVRVLGLWVYMSRIKLRHCRQGKPQTTETVRELNRRHEAAVMALWERQRGGCKVCGMKLMPRQMQVHHIRPVSIHPELRWEPGNMQGVCARCHQLLHSVAATPEAARAELLWMARRDAGRTE